VLDFSAMTVPAIRVVPGHPVDTLAWLRGDLAFRLAPFAAAVAAVAAVFHPRWLGLNPGDARAQLLFGLLAAPVLFVAATAVQMLMSRWRGALRVPDGADAALQAGYYVLNGPIEEGVFRGLIQGGVAAVLGGPAGFAAGTLTYVLYHRLGRWWWPDVLVTALVGVPLGLAFWLLPGPPSLLGVSIAHVGATCGYLGVGPYLLRRLRLV
jgi:membrane protease YdiL (CAAX protease family)